MDVCMGHRADAEDSKSVSQQQCPKPKDSVATVYQQASKASAALNELLALLLLLELSS